jgi:hypothetical protein
LGLAALVGSLVGTGVLTLFAGGSGDAWVFAIHDAMGIAIAGLLVVKLRRVWPRLTRGWDRRTVASVVGVAVVMATLGSGFAWAEGVTPAIVGYDLLAWHDALGAVLVVAVLAHMAMRAKRLLARDVAQRRQFLTAAGLAGGSLLAWRAQRPVEAWIGLRGAKRRFTGSYEADSLAGNAFPTTSWVADNPRPIALDSYRLRVVGLVTHPLALPIGQVAAGDELIATLDCTGAATPDRPRSV